MLGNPSISMQVSTYKCSLCRRKVQAGEVAVSAHAITSDLLSKLYHYNHLLQNWSIHPYQPGVRGRQPSEGPSEGHLDDWGGGHARRLVQAAYMIAFLCLLRFDEVLKIQMHDIEFFADGFVLTLPFCKTHQNGDIKPYYLWVLREEEAHLCAARALAEWTTGCQYLHLERRWPLRRICEWGGWSQEFTNLTIVKYLISLSDDDMERREDFFNPNRQLVVKCSQCGRSCPCA
ncbi:hypothetical protein BU15DRAFT_89934 [Melanogaster broomeanus]|nr:hypothetical protein BU15DRAFT_89934 [Melanogaster broomeanus]